MAQPAHVTWVEINLDALAANVRALRRRLPAETALFAVVKANAYGHGAVEVARAALAAGAAGLCVARVAEGVALREANVDAPIWILGWMAPQEADACARLRLIPTVNSVDQVRALAEANSGTPLPVHVKVDTGMSRYGLLPHEVLPFVRALSAFPQLRLEGLWTHLARADEADPAPTRRQLETFRAVARALESSGLAPHLYHVAASAAVLHPSLAGELFQAVRVGIALYGLYPSDAVAWPVCLVPVLSWKARVARVRTLPPGTPISYGGTYVTPRATRVALVAAGYGDGYPRALSNRGAVLIGGRRCPILGRVCMDGLVVDVSHVDTVQEGDEVVLIGRQGNEHITADELAYALGTINYEIVTRITARVPRLYVRPE
ncbi:MAG: alanine racemase [Ardenticatenia bacterium]|nr:alanine racemase [Ardenticatenia bacterium]